MSDCPYCARLRAENERLRWTRVQLPDFNDLPEWARVEIGADDELFHSYQALRRILTDETAVRRYNERRFGPVEGLTA